jgi:hypothetical protein
MTDAFDDLDTARATITAQVEQARERSLAMTVLAERVNATTATVRSPRGEVAITATATATITEVALTEAATALRPDALGLLITETIGRAQRAAAEKAIAAAAETLGPDSGVVAQLRADVETRFAPDDTTLR